MSGKRSRHNKPEKSKKIDSKPKSSSHGPFVSENAKFKHSILCKKQIISGRSVLLADFEHLNLAQIFRANSLEHLVTIKEQVFLELAYMFYSNLSFRENIIHSRVKNFNIDIS